uniref:Uncharacterized protein n=1 Tax=Junco hyemalis TaxID=40217 RepID=A0A8C5IDV8_JUNHY
WPSGCAPLHRLSPRTMLNVLLLCCGLLQGIQAVLDLRTADLSCGHVQKASGGLERVDRARQASLQRKGKEASAEPAGALPRLGFEQMALGVQEADGDLVQRGSLLEPQDSGWQFSAAGREEIMLFCMIPCCLCLSDHKVISSKLSIVGSETESQMGCLWSGRL